MSIYTDINQFFDENGFATIPVRFETITDLEFNAQEFYEETFKQKILSSEELIHLFSNYCKDKQFTDREQSLVALALLEYYDIDGLDSFINE